MAQRRRRNVQRGEQRIAASHAAAGPDVAAPDAPSAPSPAGPSRDGRGRFLPGHLETIRTALHTDRLPPELAHIRREVAVFLTACVGDEGVNDTSEIPTRRRSLLEYRARLHRRILQLDAALELRGLIDKRGKLRVAWLQQLGGFIDRARQLDALLGLDRMPKDVTDDPATWLRSQSSQSTE